MWELATPIEILPHSVHVFELSIFNSKFQQNNIPTLTKVDKLLQTIVVQAWDGVLLSTPGIFAQRSGNELQVMFQQQVLLPSNLCDPWTAAGLFCL